MRHLFLAEADSANSGSLLARSLRTQGQEVCGYCAGEHPFAYPAQLSCPLPDDDELERLIDWCDCVTVIQSNLPKAMFYGKGPAFWLARMSHKRLVLTHGGSHYRMDPALFATLYGPHTDATICYEADVMGHFPCPEHLVLPPVDLHWFTPRQQWGVMRVGHFPSNPANKGTAAILPVLAKFRHLTSEFRVDWYRQLDRAADCDVIVDQIEPRIGEWVTWATEIAALGMIPIANSHNPGPYRETYGEAPGIHICNTTDALEAELHRLNALSRAALNEENRAARAWVERCHTLEATGRVLMDRVYGPLM